ncbi:Hypothetical protein POVR2_LOCUS90 [uncultured virus]|nr:Hypothetical protein POVR2_LOCUS90 [uncultured virus]
MDNFDIFCNIAVQLDDRVLLAIYPCYPEQIKSLFSNQSFFFLRSQFVAERSLLHRPNVNWSRIYYAILRAIDEQQDNKLVPGLSYLPSLLILIELYGEPCYQSYDTLWRQVDNMKVLDYLLENYLDTEDQRMILKATERAAWRGDTKIVRRLLAMVDREEVSPDRLKKSLTNAAINSIEWDWSHTGCTLEALLLHSLSSYINRRDVFRHAGDGTWGTLRVMIVNTHQACDYMDEAYRSIVSCDKLSMLRKLVQSNLVPIDYQAIVHYASREGRTRIVKYIEAQIETG